MNSSEYWAKRMIDLEERSHKEAMKTIEKVFASYARAELKIRDEIEKWINRIAVNNEISYAEARKLLRDAELDEFKWDVSTYIEKGRENAYNGKWVKQLENASARHHISKWQAMNLSIGEFVQEAYADEDKFVKELLAVIYSNRYSRVAYEVEKGVDFGMSINVPAVEKVLENPWATDERIFSDRIWANMTQTKAQLQDALLRQFLTGGHPDEAIKHMASFVSDEVKNAKSAASRLVLTESAAIGTQAQLDCFEDLGVEEIKVVATLDSKTCNTCGDMDGVTYPISEEKIGINAPPFHCNCRCCTSPNIEGFEPTTRMMRNPETGKSEYIKNMSFKEWREKYLHTEEKD